MTDIESAIIAIQHACQALLAERKNRSAKKSVAVRGENASYDQLVHYLAKTTIPILSKYDAVDYTERKKWKEFWLITPLYGKNIFGKAEMTSSLRSPKL